MQIESLEALEKADVAPAQARAIVRAIEIEMGGVTDTLATKQDVVSLRQDLVSLRQDLSGSIAGLATRGELAELRAELAGLATRGELAGLATRGELAELRVELREGLAQVRGELRAEIHASASAGTRQMYLAILGQMVVLLGFAYFFATNIR